jgi:spore coat polysaccharide biosynthesis protein SpsF (cytidylyltransferase family)
VPTAALTVDLKYAKLKLKSIILGSGSEIMPSKCMESQKKKKKAKELMTVLMERNCTAS